MLIDKAVYQNGKLILHTEDNEAKRFAFNFKAGKYQISKVIAKRSLDSNAYAWELIGKIADVIGTSKDEVYLTMLKRYGQTGVVKMPDNHLENFCRAYKYCEPHEKLPHEEHATYMRFWVGSSHYNQQEMNSFINGIIDECKDLGIETMTPEELSVLNEWQDKRKFGYRKEKEE